ncbi:MAG: bifunctional aspartate kinase/homoserine dehydrogenase I [Candidatus Harrisonbacteria bacterium RIFCSPHIGHO2_01_FULL_44_13]|uniref:Bifunctional aspartate kinase/homoserine dehydrogenase I n=1 Tax=Candidatus Harrisonbacteria bacterium RIFCSPLOWO2_01_FULL_44_18 TaxID=1798407 RepID=A0A1G1ZKY8_9BACT|nr:MAG: bifunctional aspartate kinase/homoserine dehydrogenase I [Candidatus Harrisonbacteria bacterium RIFCSPHIGHO2_01_FULL_44_13]OGY65303.1 MAG: bifunctional aspartate kinase/homoserine dehydrogenase I [Candidatus Harrisonbacteria bacterium RIFCSPLOWO2_01_FULL_44_18]
MYKVLKFGGSSVGSAERIKNVCRIIKSAANKDQIVVVVSAMQGVTDKLLALDFDWVKERHLAAAKELKIKAPLDLLAELENIIKGVKMIGDASPMALDLVASFGERLSASLITEYFNKSNKRSLRATFVDARELVRTDNNFQNAVVDFVKTNLMIRNSFRKLLSRAIPIITGFIGSTIDGKTTTLGRGGSDYTAAIFGAALNAGMIEIWTDVDGVMSADPRIVPAAVTLPRLSYEEAFEMAHFGAKVIYPPTILPAIKKNIPILIKNTFNPRHSGTLITGAKDAKKDVNAARVVKNISSIDDIGLINIGGANLAGIPGTAERIFKVIAAKKVNVILISQASSEYTVCLAVSSKGGKKSDVEKATVALRKEFENELAKGQVVIDVKKDQCIVAAVGDNMRGVPGIAGKVFHILGQNKINISAIAQGSSERNISFVINQSDKTRAINALHRQFFSDADTAGLFLIGAGNVGSELLNQFQKIKNSRLKICAIADVNKMVFNNSGLNLKNWRQVFQRTKSKVDLRKFLAEARDCLSATKILVDCTASEAIVKMYPEFVTAGCDIVTPNKKANVLPMSKYNALRKTLALHNKTFHYQANVGAGLPVIVSVKELVAAGDKIKKIEGIFSGTLSYLFNNFDPKRKFSSLVAEAKARGYTEPDPREDLSGQDVGRKLLILAREMGLPAELSDVQLESLVDYDDAYFAKRYKKAKAKNCVLRYVGAIANGKLSAKLKEVPINNPLADVQGTDNIVAIYSNYYNNNPLVIKGPGAGAEVTAAAVLAGIIKTIKNL